MQKVQEVVVSEEESKKIQALQNAMIRVQTSLMFHQVDSYTMKNQETKKRIVKPLLDLGIKIVPMSEAYNGSDPPRGSYEEAVRDATQFVSITVQEQEQEQEVQHVRKGIVSEERRKIDELRSARNSIELKLNSLDESGNSITSREVMKEIMKPLFDLGIKIVPKSEAFDGPSPKWGSYEYYVKLATEFVSAEFEGLQ